MRNDNSDTVYQYDDGANDTEAIATLAREAVEPKPVNLEHPTYVQVPEGSRLEILDGKDLRPHFLSDPGRKYGTCKPGTVAGLIDYVRDSEEESGAAIWVPITAGTIVAILNDNRSEPGWGDWRAELNLTKTPEWIHWESLSGQLVDQEVFADHVEVGMEEIIQPDAADLLEMAQSIHATNNVKFRSNKRLTDGRVQFEYSEDLEATAGSDGTLEIPQEFTLAIAPFIGEEPYELKARLRYRLKEGGLTIGYKLIRPEAVLRDAYERIATTLAENTELLATVYRGEPARSRGI